MSTPAPKVKKAMKPRDPAAHPKYSEMISGAIQASGNRKGSSCIAILRYITTNYKVDVANAPMRLKLTIKKMLEAKTILPAAVAGKKGSGHFKLAPKPKVLKPKLKKPAVKKAMKPKKGSGDKKVAVAKKVCLLYTSPSPRDKRQSRMPSSA